MENGWLRLFWVRKNGKSREERNRESIPSHWLLGLYLHLLIRCSEKNIPAMEKTPLRKILSSLGGGERGRRKFAMLHFLLRLINEMSNRRR